MKKIFILVCLSSVMMCTYAQSSQSKRQEKSAARKEQRHKKVTEEGIDDPAAHDILQKVRKQIKSFKSISLKFTYTLENKKEKIKDTKKGSIITSGSKYQLDFMGLMIYSNGKKVWSYNADTKEVQISKVIEGSTDNITNPLEIINNYEKDFRVKLIREDKQSDGSVYAAIDLQPLKGRSYSKIRMIIDKDKNNIIACEVYDKSGTIYTYKIDKLQPNVAVKESDFIFDISKYPGVEVIDLQ